MASNGVLDARDRSATLSRLAAERFDVLVIGGGITGAGAALDAASRGLRVALVEARDLASGTSSRSSKLVHGGLRYLELFDFKLVYEALRERDLLVSKLAPHLVKPVSFLYPLYRKVVERPYVGAGLALYDAMEGTRRPVPHHRHLSARGALRLAPGLSPARLAGAMLYYDAQVDDARHTLTVARTAAAHSAVVATRVSAVKLSRGGDGNRVTGARVRDEESGREFTVTADSVVVCAGVWTDLVHELAGVRAGYRVRMSKGVHIVVPREAVQADTGMIVRTEKSVLFFIPWSERWIVGTTDTDWSGDRAEPAATEEDIDYILAAANRVLLRPLTRADVIAVYAGLRPLVAAIEDAELKGDEEPGADEAPTGDDEPKDLKAFRSSKWEKGLRVPKMSIGAKGLNGVKGIKGVKGSKPTTKVSREHVVDVPLPGLASIAGGKFTTYRLMARDVVDAAVADFDREVPGSVTDQLPLLGADGLAAVQAGAGRLAEDYGVSRAVVEHLLGRYGTLASGVLDLIRADPGLARPLAEGHPYLRAEVAYAVTHEDALHVEDVLMRRMRLFIESADSGTGAAAEVSTIMGRLLGWNRRKRAAHDAALPGPGGGRADGDGHRTRHGARRGPRGCHCGMSEDGGEGLEVSSIEGRQEPHGFRGISAIPGAAGISGVSGVFGIPAAVADLPA
jgi:glycerol-3-phosphate dehydrogenase